jgi:MFS family permease
VKRPTAPDLWPLLALNFFMADMQSGIGPFVGVFLQSHGWSTGLIGTAITIGTIAGVLVTVPFGGIIDATRHKRLWVIVPGICVVAGSALILISQGFWVIVTSQIATAIAGAAIVPAVTGITLGLVRQKGFNRQNGRNQAFNHAGNLVGAGLSGYLGYRFGYVAVFLLAAAFGAVAITCVLMLPAKQISYTAARGVKDEDEKNAPSALRVLLTHRLLLVLGTCLATFHLGNAAVISLFGLAAVADHQADGPSFVATTVVVAQLVMIATSIVGMRAAEGRGYWWLLLVSFAVLPLRGVLASALSGWWGLVPVQILDGVGTGLQSVAVPGVVARSLNGTGRINLGQGAVLTVQGVGASLSPAFGGWTTQAIGYRPAFLVLGALGLISTAIWIGFASVSKRY